MCIGTGKSLLSFKVFSGTSQENFSIHDAQGFFFLIARAVDISKSEGYTAIFLFKISKISKVI